METFGIGELADRTGVRPSAIRYYESLGLLTAARGDGGWRRYNTGAVEHLNAIRMARDLGFALEEIQTLLNGFSPVTPPAERWQQLAREKVPQLDELIRHASAMKRLLEVGLSCRCVRIEDCFVQDCSGVGTSGRSGLNLVPLRPAPASVLRADGMGTNRGEGVGPNTKASVGARIPG